MAEKLKLNNLLKEGVKFGKEFELDDMHKNISDIWTLEGVSFHFVSKDKETTTKLGITSKLLKEFEEEE